MKFINRKFVWLSLSLVLFSFQANAQEKTFDDSVLSESGKQAYQSLLKVKLFALGGIGYGGETSEGEEAFDILIEEKEATSAFKSLIKNATVEGAFYGVFGLKMNDCECFQEKLDEFMSSRILNNDVEKFSTQSGCLGFSAIKSLDKKIVIDRYVENFDQLAQWKQGFRKQKTKIKRVN